MATTGKPTSRQLSYLKSLANQTGQTFTCPHTSREAHAEISRLKHAKPSSHTERYVERKLIADQIQAGPQDAARVRDHEISGHGSNCRWSHRCEPAKSQLAGILAAPGVAGRRDGGENGRYERRFGSRPGGLPLVAIYSQSMQSLLGPDGVYAPADVDAALTRVFGVGVRPLHMADLVITIGCGDQCPYTPGKRYVDGDLTDPAGLSLDEVRASAAR